MGDFALDILLNLFLFFAAIVALLGRNSIKALRREISTLKRKVEQQASQLERLTSSIK